MANDPLKIQFVAAGADEVAAQANKVSGSLTNVGTSAEQANAKGGGAFGALGGSLGKLAAGAAVAGAAIKTVGTAFGEFAEGEQMTIELRKFGVSAGEAAKQADLLYNIETFTGSKIEAARLYGEVTNGIGRSLRRYGIELSATSTEQERMNALLELGARGAAVQEAQATTLTGSWELFKRKAVDMMGDMAGWVVETTRVTQGLQWLNEKLFGVKPAADGAATGIKGVNDEMGKTPKSAKEAAEALTKELAAALKDVEDRAAGVMQRVQMMRGIVGKKDDGGVSSRELEDLDIAKREAGGADPIEIAAERAKVKQDRAYQDIQADREAAERTKAESADARAKLEAIKAGSEEERAAIEKQKVAAQAAAEEADRLISQLPNRRKAADLQKEIDDAAVKKMEKDRAAQQQAADDAGYEEARKGFNDLVGEEEKAGEKDRANIEKGFGSDAWAAAQDALAGGIESDGPVRQSKYDRERGASEMDRFNNETRAKGGGAAPAAEKAAASTQATEAKVASAMDKLVASMERIGTVADAAAAKADLAMRTSGQGGEGA